ncbi:MAG: leucine--tRNA ligase [Chloroflexi bacterium]|nr:leucine--tRNA ligase [Chloroflexota bacterium]MQC25777.1 leucine--tRNA ligase [Chloroflexota bacterium]MQC47783.1 leucine--tRNA ligase [Chloroflexota bacterium]
MTAESQTTESARYQPGEIEPRWRERWLADGLNRTPDHLDGRPNRYHLTMFPYPSGDIHVGHWWAMAPSDTLARFFRMKGWNVLFPMGFDAFGLPAENAAIKGGAHPADWTAANIERMRKQLQVMGASFDWEREVNTSAPEYYRWTQWWFVQLFNRGLAYRKDASANWCPSCNTTLANEQVVDGRCERCDTEVVQRQMEQWFFRTTQYAEELLDNQDLDWPEHVKLMQRNWIGRSEGAEFSMRVQGHDDLSVRVFTTRPDTSFGMTFAVLAPEHALVDAITTPEQRAAVDEFVERVRRSTEIERLSTEGAAEKRGVFTGAYAINPFTEQPVPIYLADYVLTSYGTGAIMAVPGQDQRDWDFAKAYGLPIVRTVQPPDGWEGEAYTGDGPAFNSQWLDGLLKTEAVQKAIAWLEERGLGERKVNYRLRDWLISRQRYWGAPIPIVYCDNCGAQAVPEDQLPVALPYDVQFLPTGQSPLATSEAFVNTSCPTCSGPARRETDTMDTFMCSSWYFMRYPDPNNAAAPFSPAAAEAWLPVDQYTGGSEHATMHLLYARFFYKVARDMGLVSGDEPFTRYYAQGQIMGPDGRRMSKSRGNVVAPDGQVQQWGADTFRAYLMFLGPWDQGGPYDVDGIVGVARWLHRVWAVVTDPPALIDAAEGARDLRHEVHATLKRIGEGYESKRFNTVISALMELTNVMQRLRDAGTADRAAWDEAVRTLLLMVAPACPHIAEELWERTGGGYSIHQQSWPLFDPTLAVADTIELPVQVNGKLRARVSVPAEADEAMARAAAEADTRVSIHLEGQTVARVIYVPGRLLNLVVRGGG